MNTKNLLRKLLFKYLQEGDLKSRLRCFWYNLCERNEYKIYYRKKHFYIVYTALDGLTVKFPYNPYYLSPWTAPKGYLSRYQPQRGDVVVDAGAYVGVFTLIASKIVGNEGKVIAFEPDKANYQKILRNIELNEAENIIPINKGLWSEDTTLTFGSMFLGTSSFGIDKPIGQGSIRVQVVSLDKELERLRINRVDFVKMDIEGAEIEAVKGCRRILRENNVKLAIATYHKIDGDKTFKLVEKQLTELGYKCKTAYPEHLTTYGFR